MYMYVFICVCKLRRKLSTQVFVTIINTCNMHQLIYLHYCPTDVNILLKYRLDTQVHSQQSGTVSGTVIGTLNYPNTCPHLSNGDHMIEQRQVIGQVVHAHLALLNEQGMQPSDFQSTFVIYISNNFFTLHNFELMSGSCTCQCHQSTCTNLYLISSS